MFKTLAGIILGGILAYAWSCVSWMLLPFHMDSLNGFSNEQAVAEAIQAGASEPGIYILPGDMSKPEEEKMAALENGPYMFAAVRPGAKEGYSMTRIMVRGLLATLVSAIVLGIMLAAAAPRLNYLGRVMFVTMGGIFAAIAGIYPDNIWWEFPVNFTGWVMLDLVVGWFVAGLAMAGLINGK